MLHSQIGDSLGRRENLRDMDSAGEKDAHKQTGTSCIETSSENLFESTGNRVTANSDRQYSSPDLLSENRGYKKCTNYFFKQILELLLSKKVTVPAEYLPSAPKRYPGIEPCRSTDSSK